MSKILAIYGSGGMGKPVLDIAYRVNALSHRWDKFIFIDDYTDKTHICDLEVYKFDALDFSQSIDFLVALGEPSHRELLYNRIKDKGGNLTTLIDPTAIVSPFAEIGEGSIIAEFVCINTQAKIGCNCAILQYAVVGDCAKIGNHTILAPQSFLGGNVCVGDKVFLGVKSTLKEKINIGDNAVVAMCSAVFKDVEENCLVFGNPARKSLRSSDGKIF